MSEIKAALNAEEWEHLEMAERGPTNEHGGHNTLFAYVDDQGVLRIGWNGESSKLTTPALRHHLGALCLHEQSFGFTREMLVALGEIIVDARIMHGDRCTEADERQECERNAEFADAIFDCVEALLPPEEP